VGANAVISIVAHPVLDAHNLGPSGRRARTNFRDCDLRAKVVPTSAPDDPFHLA
jgi:hypothetical protein